MIYCCIDGKFLPTDSPGLPLDNRAFRYGYGLFETMLVVDGRIRLESAHWQRLATGMSALGISAGPHFAQELRTAIAALLRKNRHETLGRVRLQVWAGNGGHFDGSFGAHFAIESFPLTPENTAFNENGLVLGIAKDLTKAADALSQHKTCNALPYALAARQAKAARWNDAILINQFGRLADTTIANIFCIKDGGVFTPPLSEGPVAGVVRHYLLEILAKTSFKVCETAISTEMIETSEAIFLTNAIRGIRWVSAVGDKRYAPGQVPEINRLFVNSF